MTTTTQAITQSAGMLRPILTTAFLGTCLLFVAGFSSPDTLHASTHDTRHATGFPCH